MASVEKNVKLQFEKVFVRSDWRLFKKIAESNLRESAMLMTSHMSIEPDLQLLARNSRKRLLIGVGMEILLKAIYLKHGYAINKLENGSRPNFPFLLSDFPVDQLALDRTFMLNDLIANLHKVVQFQNRTVAVHGLEIAKVFRNKEGNGVTKRHTFVPSNYTDIATSLIELYRDGFNEKLSVRFAMEPNERGVWGVSPL